VVRCDLQNTRQLHLATINIYTLVVVYCDEKISFDGKETILHLFKLLVRPHLKYHVQAWRPHFKKGIDLIEGCSEEQHN